MPVSATDPDEPNEVFTYTASGLPPGLSISPVSGQITGSLGYEAAGTYEVTVTVSDAEGEEDSAQFTWTVSNTNRPPRITTYGGQSTEEGEEAWDFVSGTDPDSGDTLTFSADGLPPGLSIDATTGIITGTVEPTAVAAPHAAKEFEVTVTVRDNHGAEASDSFVWTVINVNHYPTVTAPEAQTTAEGESVSLTIDATDPDEPDDELTYTAEGLPEGLSIDPGTGVITGRPRYTAAQSQGGSYTVTVTATDLYGASDSAQFSWTVTDTNRLTDPGQQLTAEGDAASLQLEATDNFGDALTYAAAGLPPGLGIDPTTGLITGTPDYDVVTTPGGERSFTVKLSVTGGGATDERTVTWKVKDTNRDPKAADDTATTDEDTPATIGVLANDTDPDDDTLTVSAVGTPGHGTATVEGSSVKYTPDTNWNGTDSFTYTLSDGRGGTSTGKVTVTVKPVNDDPEAKDDEAEVDEDSSVTIDVVGNDSDVDGDSLTVSSAGGAEFGEVTFHGSSVTYTPYPDFHGEDSFRYTISDGHGGTASAEVKVTVKPVNDDPDAADDDVEVDEDDSVTVPVLDNDSDVDGDSLTVSEVGTPAHGTAVVEGSSITYTPDPDYNGDDSFTYTVSDGQGGTATATVRVTVNPVNDDPEAEDDEAEVDEEDEVTIDVLDNDSDVDEDELTVTDAGGAAHGTVTFDDTSVTYTPNPDYNGEDSFTYTVSDGNDGTATATVYVTVKPVNDDPVAEDDEADAGQGEPVHVRVLDNDSDVDGDTLTVSNAGGAAHGEVTFSPSSVTYTAHPGWRGGDSFTYTVRDENGGFDTATVTILADRLTLDHPGDQHSLEGDAIDIALTTDPPDAEGVTFEATGLPGGVTIDPHTGRITGTVAYGAAAAGPYHVRVTASDGYSSDTQEFTWEVVQLEVEIDEEEIDEGTVVGLTIRYGEFDRPQTRTAVIDWGDGTKPETVTLQNAGGGEMTATHYYGDDRQPGDPGSVNGRPAGGNFTASDRNRIKVTFTNGTMPNQPLRGDTSITVKNAAPTGLDIVVRKPDQGEVAEDGYVIIQPDIHDASNVPAELPEGTPWPELEDDSSVPQDRFRKTIDWDDGQPPEIVEYDDTQESRHHDYNLRGELNPGDMAQVVEKTIRVTAADDDEPDRTVTKTATVRVRLLPPSLSEPTFTADPEPGNVFPDMTEGRVIRVRGQILHPGPATWQRVRIDWGDDSPLADATITRQPNGQVYYEATHVYADNGPPEWDGFRPYAVRITAYAAEFPDHPLTRTADAYIDNAAPDKVKAQIESVGAVTARTVRVHAGSFADLGIDDTHTVTIDWGDGHTSEPVELVEGELAFGGDDQLTHQYTADGDYVVTVTVADKDGGEGTVQLQFVAVSGDVLHSFLTSSQKAVDQGILDTVFTFAGQLVDVALTKAQDFVSQVQSFVSDLRALEQSLTTLFQDSLPKVLDALLENPANFVTNFFDAAREAFTQFRTDLPGLARDVLLQYLSTRGGFNVTAADVPAGDEWGDVRKVGGFVLKVLGVTWDDLLAKVTKEVGPEFLSAALEVYDYVQGLVADGKAGQAAIFAAFDTTDPNSALSKLLAELQDPALGGEVTRALREALTAATIRDKAIDAGMAAAVNRLPGMIATKVATLLVPGGNGFTVLKTLYGAAGWLVTNVTAVREAVTVADVLAQRAGSFAADPGAFAAVKGQVVAAIVAAVKGLGPVVLDFAASAAGFGGLATKAGNAVKRLRDGIDAKITQALRKVASAGRGVMDKGLNLAVPHSTSSPDYKGVIGGRKAILDFQGTDEKHHLFLRYNASTRKVEVMLASLPSEAKKLLDAWRANWAGHAGVLAAIGAVEGRLAGLAADLSRLTADHTELASLAGVASPTPAQERRIKTLLVKYAADLKKYLDKAKGALLAAATNLFKATNGEWAPGHSMSGLRTAEIAAQLLTERGKSLSDTDRLDIRKAVWNVGGYGGWGDETSLARDIVGRLFASGPGASLGGVIGPESAVYFGTSWNTKGLRERDSQLRSKPTGKSSWMDYINSFPGGLDARGKTEAQVQAEYTALSAGDPVKYPPTFPLHGHHIVFKKGAGLGKEASQEAKDILLYYGIDPFFGQENLAYAPNYGGHPGPAMDQMRDELKAAYDAHLGKAEIIRLLQDFAGRYITKALRGMR